MLLSCYQALVMLVQNRCAPLRHGVEAHAALGAALGNSSDARTQSVHVCRTHAHHTTRVDQERELCVPVSTCIFRQVPAASHVHAASG